MTRNKDQKRIIRNRMKKTGESYTAARAQLLSKPSRRSARSGTTAAPAPAPAPARALAPAPAPARALTPALVAGMSDEKVMEATGRNWRDWTAVLDAENATTMRHRDVARLVHEKYGVREWWTQMVTVGYERIKGLRDRGQRLGGAYEVSKSKTYNVPIETLFRAWADDSIRRRWMGVTAKVRTATAPKSIRLQWTEGAIIAAWFTAKGPTRSAVALAHTKLASRSAADAAKKEWTARLAELERALTSRE
jgi:hypothetical protein